MLKIFKITIIIFFVSITNAEPVLDQTTGLEEPILRAIYIDSKTPNQYWFMVKEYDLCGAEDRQPDFSYRSRLTDAGPIINIEFTICPVIHNNLISKIELLLKKKDKNSKLSPMPSKNLDPPKPYNHPGYNSKFTCAPILPLSNLQKYKCRIINVGSSVNNARKIQFLFTEYKYPIVSAQTVDLIEGVETDVNTGKTVAGKRIVRAGFSLNGMRDYPWLLDIGWQPSE